MLLTPSLLLLLLLMLSVHTASGVQAVSSQLANDVFNFDFTWQPLRPLENDTVHFRAIGISESYLNELNNVSFRWYRQMPSADFRLLHIGKRYSLNASDYFEGRYKLSVKMSSAAREVEYQSSWSQIDIVKYIGLQRRIRSALIVQNLTGSRPSRRIICRYWGYPLVESLKFVAPKPEVCQRSGHFETVESEPYIDLVSVCSTDRLPAGEYSCYGRNSIGDSRLKCRLTDSQAQLLGYIADCPEVEATDFDAPSRQIARSQVNTAVATNGAAMTARVAMGTVLSCLVLAMMLG